MTGGEDFKLSLGFKEEMFKRLKALFSLEDRLAVSLQAGLQDSVVRFQVVEKELIALRGQLDQIEAKTNERLSKIEVLFAEELEAKMKARDAAVKERRLNV